MLSGTVLSFLNVVLAIVNAALARTPAAKAPPPAAPGTLSAPEQAASKNAHPRKDA